VSGWLRRLSATYRTAVSAEAAGEYIEAAKAYALCDERHKVAEMHILEAGRRAVPGSAVGELLVAVNLLRDDREAPALLLKRLGEALLRLLRSRDLVDSDRELALHAGRVLARADEPVLAAEAFERAGDVERAVEVLTQAGDIERVERLLAEQARVREQTARETELHAAYESALLLGRRDAAYAQLRTLCEVAKDAREPQRLADELRRKLLTCGQVELWLSSSTPESEMVRERVLFALPPLLVGRGEECSLVLGDPGVSRQHVRLSSVSESGFAVTDLGSKNGTFLDGLQLSEKATLPLRHEGELGIGQHLRMQFTVESSILSMQLRTGMRRGLNVRLSTEILPLPGRLGLRFAAGRPVVQSESEELRLNGQRVPSGVQLIRGDVVEQGAVRLEVL
jgi:hypothetical protein